MSLLREHYVARGVDRRKGELEGGSLGQVYRLRKRRRRLEPTVGSAWISVNKGKSIASELEAARRSSPQRDVGELSDSTYWYVESCRPSGEETASFPFLMLRAGVFAPTTEPTSARTVMRLRLHMLCRWFPVQGCEWLKYRYV